MPEGALDRVLVPSESDLVGRMLKLVVTKVPFRYATSRVEVAVTVTIESEEVIVPFPEKVESVKLPDSEAVLEVVSVDVVCDVVMVSEDVCDSVMDESPALVASLEAGTVSVGRSSSETTMSPEEAVTVAATDVAVPSPTLTSMTLAVTVVSARGTSSFRGLRGIRWMSGAAIPRR
jgi:hypothetical protein